MSSSIKIIESVCLVCGRVFLKNASSTNHRRGIRFAYVRPAMCKTCSKQCSRLHQYNLIKLRQEKLKLK